ncbi:Disease resistance protein L6 [Linum perenne]
MTSVGRNLVADLDCKRLDMDQQMWPSAEQQLSAPSSSRSSLPKEYEVFLSFRGPDVREHFADFLHTHLVRFGIRTFLDDEDLPKGEDIEASLLKDIQNSKVYIPVLSPDYASSKWCLKELALMVKCCKQSNGHLLLPIFYMVEPRDARQQGNSYEEAFQQHSKIYDAETVMEWRKALKEVGKLKGWHVTKSVRQGIVVDQVLSNVSSHLDRDYMLRTDKLFGIEGHIENLKKLLHSDDECVKIIGIHGMGGLGKTTIAKELYNHVHKQFDRYCFVQDVRETLLKTNGIVKLQKIILSRIMCSDVKVLDANRGINMIKSRICTYKVLIILDDVDNRLEFDKIFGELEEFRLGSRFVITTRDRKVVEFFPHYELYEPKLMGEEFSLQLFSRHAFRENHPPQEYVALSKEFVKIAAGLPLAVKVIGSLLFREDERFWKAKLMQLEDIPILEVQEILRISYEGLTPEVQHVFCDIACHFVGEQNDQHFYMWSDCGFHPEIAITILVQRSLLKVNESNSFWMHDHIRDLGRTIVRQENVQFPWKRSRIWCNKDALDMLTHKEGSAELQTLEVNILEAEYFELEDTRFEKLSGLRYLKVTGGGLVGNFIKVLPKLCWLQLFSCSSFPTDLDMENLVILQMEYCSVTDDWRGWERIKEAHKLKSMSLRHCHMLRKVPDLSRCENLEEIFIEDCDSMSGELHIGNLNNLRVLDVCWINITELSGLGLVRKLEILKIVNASNLANLDGLEHLILLKKLKLESCAALKKLPSFSNLTRVQDLNIALCQHLPEFSGNGEIGKPLSSLLIDGYDNPEYSGSMEPLLPFLSNLEEIFIEDCDSMSGELHIGNLNNLRVLDVCWINITELSGLGLVRKLEILKIVNAPNLANLNGLEHLILLKKLKLESCAALKNLPSFSNLTKMQELGISLCQHLPEFSGNGEMGKPLSSLLIDGYDNPEYSGSMEPLLPFLFNLENLQLLEFTDIGTNSLLSQEHFLDLSGLPNLRDLSMSGCKRFTEVIGFERLELLCTLHIADFTSLRKLSNLSGVKKVKSFGLFGCPQLTEVIGVEEMESLVTMSVPDCPWSENLPDMSGLKHFKGFLTRSVTFIDVGNGSSDFDSNSDSE